MVCGMVWYGHVVDSPNKLWFKPFNIYIYIYIYKEVYTDYSVRTLYKEVYTDYSVRTLYKEVYTDYSVRTLYKCIGVSPVCFVLEKLF